MARASLPPGFRFHPTDVELIMYYLKRKVMGKKLHVEAIAEVNIYKFSPWDLPDKSCLRNKDLEWFFFCPREKKYASGVRVKRATENGYWKTTGKDRPICHNDRTVGTVKTLVFHLGHAPKGERTDWVIHEYKIRDDQLAAAGVQDTYVLCKVFKKSGPGPKNGAQYGAPFNEADWADDDFDDAQNHAISLTSYGPSPTPLMLLEKQNCPPVTGLFGAGSMPELPLVEKGSSPSVGRSTSEVLVDETGDDEILHLLASFTDEDMLPFIENGINQDDLSGKGKGESLPGSDGCDVYNGLDDLDGWGQMNEDRLDFSGMQKDDYCLNNMPLPDNSAYIELNDLLDPLPSSPGVIGTDRSSVSEIFGSYSHESMNQFYSGGSFAGMDQYAACADQLPALPEGSNSGDNCLEVLQMVNNQFYNGYNAAYDLDYALGQLENGVNFTQDMERGKHTKKYISRIMESIPARAPSAAEQIALSFCPICGGSSIHIKAEVTHGAGECTKEALSLMMGGSGSCWCNLLRPLWLGNHRHLLYLVGFKFDVVLVCYTIIETLAVLWSYYCYYPNMNSFIIFFSTNLSVNLLNSFIKDLRFTQMQYFVEKVTMTRKNYAMSLVI